MKNILIAGASGMIGELILQECLSSDQVNKITSLVRRPSDSNHPKLQEVVIDDFTDYKPHQELFKDIDAAFFCIGVYTGQVPDEQFKLITVDYAVAFAEALADHNPDVNLCLLSGAGADKTEKSRTSFAKYKGMSENRIAAMNLSFYSFRPAYIYPVVPRNEPNLMYRVTRTLYPIIKLMGKNASIKSTDLAHAMFTVGMSGTDQEILENKDIFNISES